MKKLIYVLMIGMFIGFTANNAFAQKKGNEVVCYKSNMDCVECEKTITEHLKFEKGVKDLKVDHVSNTIVVEYKSGKNTKEGFAKAIEKKGYTAESITTEEYNKIVAHSEAAGDDHKNEKQEEKK